MEKPEFKPQSPSSSQRAFCLEPHTPQGRNPVRGSAFHENEPPSPHRLIQLSQLHISESFPHPSRPSQPQAWVPARCPPLCLGALKLRRMLSPQGVCTLFGPAAHLTEKGSLGPRVAELRLKSGNGSSTQHLLPQSSWAANTRGLATGQFQNSPERARGRREGAAQWVRSHLLLCVPGNPAHCPGL